MKPFKRIPIFLTLCLALIVGITTTQAQFNTGASTKLVLIDSFNDFASVQPANNTKSVIVVRYGSTEGDQKGGTFMYDSTSAASADGLNVFVPPSGVGRFLRFDNAVFLSKTATANRVIVTNGSGTISTDNDITFDGSNLTVTGNMTVGGLATGSTDDVVIRNGSDLLQYRQINPDVWNLAGDLDNSGENVASATKIVAPQIRFDGADDVIEVADSDNLTFSTSVGIGANQGGWSAATNTPFLTDGVGTSGHYYNVTAAGTQNFGAGAITFAAGDVVSYDGSVWSQQDKDDLPFTISAWVKTSQIGSTELPVAAKWDTSAREEYRFGFSSAGDLELWLRDESSSQSAYTQSTSAQTAYNGEWVHIAATYGGTSGGVFSTAADNITLYVNGASVAATASNNASYFGVENTVAPLVIGERSNSIYFNGHIRDVKIYNRELTAAEVAESMKGDLGFADEWGGPYGNVYTSDFTSDSADSWTGQNGTIDATQTHGGDTDNLVYTVNNVSGSTHRAQRTLSVTTGKRYRIDYEYFMPSSNDVVDGFVIQFGSANTVETVLTAATDAWTKGSAEGLWSGGDTSLRVYPADGGSVSINDAGGDDKIALRNIKVTEIGTLADFRAEQFDETTDKLYDISSNAFVGVNSGASLVGRSVPVFEVGTWTPTVTFGGGSTGITYTTQEGHYTREGNWVSVHAYIVLSSKGSDTGTALIAGLPFTARNTTASSQSLVVGNMANAANLTSAVTAYATDNGTTINLVDWGATGSAVLDDTNFGNTTSISITGKYQIQ